MNPQHIINDIRSKRDALSLYHHELKKNSDEWNKLIIVLSLMCGFIETAKIQLSLTSDFFKLLPIAINCSIAICSSLVKFRDYPRRMEVVLGARDSLSHFLTKIRGMSTLDEPTLREYYTCLEFLEVSITPSERRQFVKSAQLILLRITKNEEQFAQSLSAPSEIASSEDSSDRDLSLTRQVSDAL